MSRLQQDKTAMEYKHSFKCGNNTYYVTNKTAVSSSVGKAG
jgi:hypothetical protein